MPSPTSPTLPLSAAELLAEYEARPGVTTRLMAQAFAGVSVPLCKLGSALTFLP